MSTQILQSARTLSPGWTSILQRKNMRQDSTSTDGISVANSSSSVSLDSRSTHSTDSRGSSVSRIARKLSFSREPFPFSLEKTDFKEYYDWIRCFALYNKLVTTKISLQDSYPADSLSRFGKLLTKDLSKDSKGGFLHGLPEPLFDLALLWCPAGPITRKPDDGSPSWSWTGWEGQVNFPFDPMSCPGLRGIGGPWFESAIKNPYVGPDTERWSIRRQIRQGDRGDDLHIEYQHKSNTPYGTQLAGESDFLTFHAPRIDAKPGSFTTEQLSYKGEKVPCSNLLNSEGIHCGVMMDYEEALSSPSGAGTYSFVYISKNLRPKSRNPTSDDQPKSPTSHVPGTPVWHKNQFLPDVQIADFDSQKYPQGEWDMYNVMLIQTHLKIGVSRRIAVGRMHKDEFNRHAPKMDKIVLS